LHSKKRVQSGVREGGNNFSKARRLSLTILRKRGEREKAVWRTRPSRPSLLRLTRRWWGRRRRKALLLHVTDVTALDFEEEEKILSLSLSLSLFDTKEREGEGVG